MSCMCVCMYAFMCVCMYGCMSVCVRVFMCGCMYVFMYLCTYNVCMNLSCVPNIVHSEISFIHVLFGSPTFLIPSIHHNSICKCDEPFEPLSTRPAYVNLLLITSF